MRILSSAILLFALVLVLAGPAHAAGSGNNQAARLVQDIRADLAPVENQIRNHPYLTALENGQIPLSNLKAFAGEQYHIIKSDLRSAAQLVARYGGTPSGDFFQGILEGEILARGYLLQFAAALGMTEADLQAYEPRPLAQTYPSYVTWLSVHATDAQVATAYVVNFAVFGENVGRMGVALRNRYGFSAAATAYFDFFAVLPPDFEPTALGIIGAGLGCTDEREIRRSSRLLQAYELDFWNAVAAN